MVGGKTGTTNLLWCVHRAEWAACMHGRDLADEGIPQATLGSTGGRDIAAWWAGNKPQLTSFGVQTRHNGRHAVGADMPGPLAAWWAGNKPQLTSFGVQTRHNGRQCGSMTVPWNSIVSTLLGQTCPAPWHAVVGGKQATANQTPLELKQDTEGAAWLHARHAWPPRASNTVGGWAISLAMT